MRGEFEGIFDDVSVVFEAVNKGNYICCEFVVISEVDSQKDGWLCVCVFLGRMYRLHGTLPEIQRYVSLCDYFVPF